MAYASLAGMSDALPATSGNYFLALEIFWMHATNILLAIMSRNWLTLTCVLPLKVWRLCEYTTVTTDESLGNAKATFRKKDERGWYFKNHRGLTLGICVSGTSAVKGVSSSATTIFQRQQPDFAPSPSAPTCSSQTVPGAVYQKVGWGIKSPAWVEKDLLTLLTWEPTGTSHTV